MIRASSKLCLVALVLNPTVVLGMKENEQPPAEEKDLWSCTVCTFDNVLTEKKCVICNVGRRPDGLVDEPDPHASMLDDPGWYCGKCARKGQSTLNKMEDLQCIRCGGWEPDFMTSNILEFDLHRNKEIQILYAGNKGDLPKWYDAEYVDMDVRSMQKQPFVGRGKTKRNWRIRVRYVDKPTDRLYGVRLHRKVIRQKNAQQLPPPKNSGPKPKDQHKNITAKKRTLLRVIKNWAKCGGASKDVIGIVTEVYDDGRCKVFWTTDRKNKDGKLEHVISSNSQLNTEFVKELEWVGMEWELIEKLRKENGWFLRKYLNVRWSDAKIQEMRNEPHLQNQLEKELFEYAISRPKGQIPKAETQRTDHSGLPSYWTEPMSEEVMDQYKKDLETLSRSANYKPPFDDLKVVILNFCATFLKDYRWIMCMHHAACLGIEQLLVLQQASRRVNEIISLDDRPRRLDAAISFLEHKDNNVLLQEVNRHLGNFAKVLSFLHGPESWPGLKQSYVRLWKRLETSESPACGPLRMVMILHSSLHDRGYGAIRGDIEKIHSSAEIELPEAVDMMCRAIRLLDGKPPLEQDDQKYNDPPTTAAREPEKHHASEAHPNARPGVNAEQEPVGFARDVNVSKNPLQQQEIEYVIIGEEEDPGYSPLELEQTAKRLALLFSEPREQTTPTASPADVPERARAAVPEPRAVEEPRAEHTPEGRDDNPTDEEESKEDTSPLAHGASEDPAQDVPERARAAAPEPRAVGEHVPEPPAEANDRFDGFSSDSDSSSEGCEWEMMNWGRGQVLDWIEGKCGADSQLAEGFRELKIVMTGQLFAALIRNLDIENAKRILDRFGICKKSRKKILKNEAELKAFVAAAKKLCESQDRDQKAQAYRALGLGPAWPMESWGWEQLNAWLLNESGCYECCYKVTKKLYNKVKEDEKTGSDFAALIKELTVDNAWMQLAIKFGIISESDEYIAQLEAFAEQMAKVGKQQRNAARRIAGNNI